MPSFFVKSSPACRALSISFFASFLLVGCGGGGDDDGPTPGPVTTLDAGKLIAGVCGDSVINTSGVAAVTVDGRITFDRVPTSNSGLNYSAITKDPARQVTVQACSDQGIYASTQTDDDGNYSISVPANTNVRILIKAEMLKSGTPGWDVTVVDNTRQKALYGIVGQQVTTGSSNSTRNLNAPHGGWDGANYTSARSAGPFAILDTIYSSMNTILPLNPTADFPSLIVNWSVDNQLVSSNVNEDVGDIQSSFFRVETSEMFVLGKADQDTDEYDDTVIAHEWGHYFQNSFSRSDNIGGTRSRSNKLDLRLAYDEGLNYALAAVINNSSILRDTAGLRQGGTVEWSAENNNAFTVGGVTLVNKGWFSEDSVINIVYDVVDGGTEPGDTVELGFSALYDVLTSNSYLEFEGALSVYAFADILRDEYPGSAAGINDLLIDQEVFGTADGFGTGETAGAEALPVYFSLSPGDTTNVCSFRDNGGFSRLGNRRLGRVSIANAGNYRIEVTTSSAESGVPNPDPDFFLYEQADVRYEGDSEAAGTEVGDVTLEAGEYWLDLYEYSNIAAFVSGGVVANFEVSENSEVCFDVSLQAR